MSEKKLHIALLFGGNSSEHDVSKRSAHTVFDALDKDKYEVSVFMFTKQGFLLGNKDSMRIFDGEPEDAVVAEAIKDVDFSNPLANIQSLSEVKDIDLFIPVIHGNMGRNTKYVVVTPENQSEYTYEKCAAELGETLFVKPARQGSSVGIYKVSNKEEFDKAIQDGFHYDFKILVEETIANPREVECSVLGNRDIKASKLGAIRVPAEDAFYDYNNKFVDASGVVFEIPVELPENLTKEIQQMSLDAFRVLGNRGLARMDFLVDENDVPYFGEVNTLPGFTNISLYPQLWAVSGINYKDLLDRLIQLAFDEFEDNAKLHYDFVELGSEKLGKGLLTDEDKK